jgi:hypothetical protein
VSHHDLKPEAYRYSLRHVCGENFDPCITCRDGQALPERKEELAWKQVTKEEAFEKIKLLLPALVYARDDGR